MHDVKSERRFKFGAIDFELCHTKYLRVLYKSNREPREKITVEENTAISRTITVDANSCFPVVLSVAYIMDSLLSSFQTRYIICTCGRETSPVEREIERKSERVCSCPAPRKNRQLAMENTSRNVRSLRAYDVASTTCSCFRAISPRNETAKRASCGEIVCALARARVNGKIRITYIFIRTSILSLPRTFLLKE